MTSQHEPILTRRNLLVTAPNARTGIDYVVTLGGELAVAAMSAPVKVSMRYVPDREILAPEVFAAYLRSLGEIEWPSLEDLGLAVLGDVNSELVPRWVQLVISCEYDGQEHAVICEDRQPKWDNPKLLARLSPI